MKRIFATVAFIALIMAGAVAQTSQSKDFYWVLVTKADTVEHSTVLIYDANNTLCQTLELKGKPLDIHNARHRRKLDQLIKDYGALARAGTRKEQAGL